ncbi:MAG: 23S rRNA pseudouridine synthase [Ignavibacteria bacterium]|nr:MAG: 23S rRNA pseudouridine synthase [Ignavibacteria bacterium]KAF0162453.1 MAG: 23S rRNA pseudouridine synthase [Ignavibacteria bacterium]
MAKIVTEKKIRIEVPDGKKKERIDIFLANSVENATRSRIQKLIKFGGVTANGTIVKANYQVCPKDIIDLTIPTNPRPEETEAEDIPLDIVYEDEFLLVVNKPAGMVAHPSLGNYSGTLVNALLHHTQKLSELNGDSFRPGIVHRIDKETSGLLLIAKDEWTHAQLAKQFYHHTIEREYWAICWGKFKQQKGEIIGSISRSNKDRKIFTVSETEGKHAHTFYEVIEEFDFTSLLKLKLKTGRTHQIRVHLNYVHHPIFGDPTYGGRKIVYGFDLPKIKARVENLLEIMKRQALHAKTLGFIHPHTKEKVFFESELPHDFVELLGAISLKTS